MQVFGKDSLRFIQENPAVQIKATLNDAEGLSVAFFPASNQHRDMKFEGLSYEDDYKGNALAAMIWQGKIEIRFHDKFLDLRELQLFRDAIVTYRGTILDPGGR